ncbi:hypothetical protein [Rhizobium halophytocola]|nr:hypothetical protein [Rhizobium halophytocola]
MKKFAILILTGSALSVMTFAQANAWTRDAHVYGWRGTSSVHASGSCAGGSCSRAVTRTGPYGNTATRQGSVSCAYGSCTGTRTTTGPNGGSITRSGTVSR